MRTGTHIRSILKPQRVQWRFYSKCRNWIMYDDLSRTQYDKLEATVETCLGEPDRTVTFPFTEVKQPPQTIGRGMHLGFFNHATRECLLSPDGYDSLQVPEIGELLPDEVLARRWIGGKIKYRRDLALCDHGICVEEMQEPLQLRSGRGRRWEVIIDRYMQNGDTDIPYCVYEQRRFLYFVATARTLERLAKHPPPSAAVPFERASHTHTFRITRPLVFRYSALTFNSHLVHLDKQYAQNIEKLPELLVQGPLLVTLMLRWSERCLNTKHTIESFEYRNLAPVYVEDDVTFMLSESPIHGLRVQAVVRRDSTAAGGGGEAPTPVVVFEGVING